MILNLYTEKELNEIKLLNDLELINFCTSVAEYQRDISNNDNPQLSKIRFSDKILLAQIPNNPFSQSKETMNNAYIYYLRLKYKYYTIFFQFNNDDNVYSELGDDNLFTEMGNDKYLYDNLFGIWKDIKDEEAVVCLLRLNQLDEKSISYWYYTDIKEFKEWVKTLTLSDEIYKDMGKHSKITEKPDTTIVNKILQRIIREFSAFLQEGKMDENLYLKRFTQIIREESFAEVCDFLEIIKDEKGENKVVFKLVSLPNEGEIKVPEFEYLKGEGISGSILVGESFLHANYHIGTNNLENDYRQSKKHTVAYYGEYRIQTSSFWIFPLYENPEISNIYAVFRVLNKTNDNTYWCYSERLQLIEIAKWFGVFWIFIKKNILNNNNKSQNFSTNYAEIINRFNLTWLSNETFFDNLIYHIMNVAHRKIENHSIGVCIAIFGQKLTLGNLHQLYEIQAQIPQNNVEKIVDFDFLESVVSLSYKSIYPLTAYHAYLHDGKYMGVIKLTSNSDVKSIEKIKEITKSYAKSVFLLSEKNQKCIRIFHAGELAADYYLSENSGNWKLRFYNELKERIRETKIGEDVQKPLSDFIMELSYRKIGAMFVLADDVLLNNDSIAKEITGSIKFTAETSIIGMVPELFYDLAMLDGAVLISKNNGIIKKAGVILSVNVNEELDDYWESKISKAQKGTRHKSAIHFSIAHPEACVVVISENRGISILHKGRALLWNDEFK